MKPGYSQMHDVIMTKDRSLFKQYFTYVVMTDFKE
jgi:hypothetical protein